MNPYVIIPVAAVLLLVFLLNIPRLNRLHEIAGTRFICPRCGYRFRVKWYKLLFTRWWVEVKDQARDGMSETDREIIRIMLGE